MLLPSRRDQTLNIFEYGRMSGSCGVWRVGVFITPLFVPLLHLTVARRRLLTCHKYELPTQTGEEQSTFVVQVTDILTFYKSLKLPAMESLLPYWRFMCVCVCVV